MPDFATTTLIIFLSVLHGRTARMGTLPMVLWRFPSTLIHEISHAILAVVTRSGISGFSLLPKRIDGGWMLGSVQCSRIGMFSAFPIGLAPLINLPLAWLAYHRLHNLTGYILTFILLTAAIPSDQDCKVAFATSIIGTLVWCMIAAVCAWLWGGGLLFVNLATCLPS